MHFRGDLMGDFLVRIYYEDTDCGGIVYHTNYIKYCERARSEIFFSANAMPNTERVGLVVRKLNAEFLDSAKLGDLLVVKTQILKLGGSSLTLLQEIYLAPDSLLLDSAKSAESAPFCHSERSEESQKNPQNRDSSPAAQNDNAKKIFQCEVKLACIDIKRKKIVKIPSEILAILQSKF